MESYAVIQFINGAFTVKFEGEDLDTIKYNFDNWCGLLWNDNGAVNGVVKLVDSNLEVVEGFMQVFNKAAKES